LGRREKKAKSCFVTVSHIQVGGVSECSSLREACECLISGGGLPDRVKLNFALQFPDGRKASISIRDVDGKTICYGEGLDGLPSFLDVSSEMVTGDPNYLRSL
jgi:hypothetical protein